MSKEEIKAVEFVKSELQDEKQARNDYRSLTGLYGNREIEILLNLIEKQQKEIEELENENKEIIDYSYKNDSLLDLYKKEKEKNKKCEYYEMVADELYKNSISKDKIKEKIEQLEKEQEQNSKELARGIDYLSKEMIEASSKKIEINLSIRKYLQELLEGDK